METQGQHRASKRQQHTAVLSITSNNQEYSSSQTKFLKHQLTMHMLQTKWVKGGGRHIGESECLLLPWSLRIPQQWAAGPSHLPLAGPDHVVILTQTRQERGHCPWPPYPWSCDLVTAGPYLQYHSSPPDIIHSCLQAIPTLWAVMLKQSTRLTSSSSLPKSWINYTACYSIPYPEPQTLHMLSHLLLRAGFWFSASLGFSHYLGPHYSSSPLLWVLTIPQCYVCEREKLPQTQVCPRDFPPHLTIPEPKFSFLNSGKESILALIFNNIECWKQDLKCQEENTDIPENDCISVL